MYSFVDYFTIPPSFVSIYLDRTWIGKGGEVERVVWKVCAFRPSISACVALNDCPGYSSIPQYTEDFQLHTTCSDSVHIYICLAYSGRDHPLGEWRPKYRRLSLPFCFVPVGELRRPLRVQKSEPVALLDVRLFFNRDHVHGGLWRRLLSHGARKNISGVLPPGRIGKCLYNRN